LDAPWKALAVLALYIGIQQVETNLLTPTSWRSSVAAASCDVTIRCSLQRSLAFLGLLLAALTVVAQVWLKVVIKDVLDQWRSTIRQTDQRSGD